MGVPIATRKIATRKNDKGIFHGMESNLINTEPKAGSASRAYTPGAKGDFA